MDENRADVPAIQLGPENGVPGTIDYDSEDFDENMLLNLDGIGIFGMSHNTLCLSEFRVKVQKLLSRI